MKISQLIFSEDKSEKTMKLRTKSACYCIALLIYWSHILHNAAKCTSFVLNQMCLFLLCLWKKIVAKLGNK